MNCVILNYLRFENSEKYPVIIFGHYAKSLTPILKKQEFISRVKNDRPFILLFGVLRLKLNEVFPFSYNLLK